MGRGLQRWNLTTQPCRASPLVAPFAGRLPLLIVRSLAARGSRTLRVLVLRARNVERTGRLAPDGPRRHAEPLAVVEYRIPTRRYQKSSRVLPARTRSSTAFKSEQCTTCGGGTDGRRQLAGMCLQKIPGAQSSSLARVLHAGRQGAP